MLKYPIFFLFILTYYYQSQAVIILPYNDSMAMLKFVKTILDQDDITIVEAGAYDGSDTIEMHKMWPNAQIHSFEPIPALFNRLVRNVKNIKNIHYYQLALSDKTGASEMHVSEDSSGNVSGSSSLLSPKEHLIYSPGALFNKKIYVNTVTINDWVKLNSVNKINFMWLDMQGYELHALMQAEDILDTVEVIVIEVEFVEAYAGQYLYRDVKTWLEKRGFVLAAKSFDSETAYWFGDAIFVKKTKVQHGKD